MNNFFKKTIKKIYKSGFFHDFVIEPNYFCFHDTHGTKYVIQKAREKFGYWLRIGKVAQWTEIGPTYESEYNSIGPIKKAAFNDFIKPVHTDNPDFILRVSLKYLIPTN